MATNDSSTKSYILAITFLILALLPFVAYFRTASSCKEVFQAAKDMGRDYGLAPQTCLYYYINKFIIPSAAFALPFAFLSLILLFKEKKKGIQSVKSKQEKIAFWLSIFTFISFLVSFVLIGSMKCEGFGCLGLSSLISRLIYVFTLLISIFSLWFLKARYQWKIGKFLAVIFSLLVLLFIAFSQTTIYLTNIT